MLMIQYRIRFPTVHVSGSINHDRNECTWNLRAMWRQKKDHGLYQWLHVLNAHNCSLIVDAGRCNQLRYHCWGWSYGWPMNRAVPVPRQVPLARGRRFRTARGDDWTGNAGTEGMNESTMVGMVKLWGLMMMWNCGWTNGLTSGETMA